MRHPPEGRAEPTIGQHSVGGTGPSFIGFVAGDGADVLVLQNEGGNEYMASRDGGAHRPERMRGLPDRLARPPKAMAGGGYLSGTDAVPTAVYLSDDGLSWRRVAIDEPGDGSRRGSPW